MLIFYYTLSIVSFLVPALWAGLLLYIYFKNLNVTLKRDIEINKKPIEVEVRVTNESIVQTQSTGSEFTLDFSDIKKIVKTKKFIYLWSKSNMLYSIKKEGFIVGSADDFLAFLKAKGFKC
ncbi:MAG: YcxB family protein [Clostridia bacterium]|nr:YcxB family protein [Clostridia bacterium]